MQEKRTAERVVCNDAERDSVSSVNIKSINKFGVMEDARVSPSV